MDPENWELAFEDRFENGTLDSDSWGIGFGWGTTASNDDATVADEDVYIENGELVLEINHHGGGEFTQGAVNTGSPDAVDYPVSRPNEGVQIGPGMYIEARMKPATRNGVLPAFWSKPDNENWPPEIDFVEVFHYGNASDSEVAHGELHYSESGQCNDESTHTAAGMGSYDAGHDLSEEWHVYGCEWQEDEIRFYFDGELYDSTDDSDILSAFNNQGCLPHYMMFSNHVNRLGTADESTTWSDETRVDWCRVWEHAPGSGSPPEDEDEEPDETDDGSEDVLVDDCSNLETLHPSSDSDALFVDTSNSQHFKRNDGNCSDDDARIARSGSTDDASMIYEPGGSISDFRVEAHDHVEYGGSFAFYASTDGGDSWTELSPERTEYCDVQAGWRHLEYAAQSVPSGTDRLRIVLSGASANWTGQVGHVEIEYGEESETDPDTGDDSEPDDEDDHDEETSEPDGEDDNDEETGEPDDEDDNDEETGEPDDEDDEEGDDDREEETDDGSDDADSEPVIEHSLVRWNTNGRWNRARVSWIVSDKGRDLKSVTTELLADRDVLETETSSVDGLIESGEHRVRSDEDVSAVRITVIDEAGTEERTIETY
ncbi:glycoside hydrolase family 16 protein [Natronorubrum sp. FCH18a]|uniref:glycoside hydrolase family 16 protein n=1 Tax=Natronorubrum sp. FCH18a TaxID=3447018 RepID=UPI003F5198E7